VPLRGSNCTRYQRPVALEQALGSGQRLPSAPALLLPAPGYSSYYSPLAVPWEEKRACAALLCSPLVLLHYIMRHLEYLLPELGLRTCSLSLSYGELVSFRFRCRIALIPSGLVLRLGCTYLPGPSMPSTRFLALASRILVACSYKRVLVRWSSLPVNFISFYDPGAQVPRATGMCHVLVRHSICSFFCK
jgi:hypothetical protein